MSAHLQLSVVLLSNSMCTVQVRLFDKRLHTKSGLGNQRMADLWLSDQIGLFPLAAVWRHKAKDDPATLFVLMQEASCMCYCYSTFNGSMHIRSACICQLVALVYTSSYFARVKDILEQ